MKVIFGIAILTAKDIDALNARIDAVERATGRNEYSSQIRRQSYKFCR